MFYRGVKGSPTKRKFWMQSLIVLLALLSISDIVSAVLVADNTASTVGILSFFTLIILILVSVKGLRARREGAKRVWLYPLIAVGLAVLLAFQVQYALTYQPWYDRVYEEEDAKPAFEFYMPSEQIENISFNFYDSYYIRAVEATIFLEEPVVIYSMWNHDTSYLKVLNNTDLHGANRGKVLDSANHPERSRRDHDTIADMALEEQNGTLVCYYTIVFTRPDGIQHVRKHVDSSDGWNWSAPVEVDSYEIGPTPETTEVPSVLTGFGWTNVESSCSYDLGEAGVLFVIRYGGHQIDNSYERGVFFAHSWDGLNWSALVHIWPSYYYDPPLQINPLGDGRYLGIYYGGGRELTLFEFDIQDLYQVNGPYQGRMKM